MPVPDAPDSTPALVFVPVFVRRLRHEDAAAPASPSLGVVRARYLALPTQMPLKTVVATGTATTAVVALNVAERWPRASDVAVVVVAAAGHRGDPLQALRADALAGEEAGEDALDEGFQGHDACARYSGVDLNRGPIDHIGAGVGRVERVHFGDVDEGNEADDREDADPARVADVELEKKIDVGRRYGHF